MQVESTRPVYASGDCEIDLARGELRIGGLFVPMGRRTFEFMEVLVEGMGQLVTKDELIHRIWPGAIVMENTLQVHAGAIRKALGPYRALLRTETGRGYRLLGNWTARHRDDAKPPIGSGPIRATTPRVGTNIPGPAAPLIGRSAAERALRSLVSAYRVVTLTGPGDIGKTALALAVARHVRGEFADGGWLVELASISDPGLVPSAVAGALGLRLGSNILSSEAVARAIAGQNLLLVLDNCEHVIDAAAALAETLLQVCPLATVLATSREVLRIEGECTYRVPPLDVPTAEEVQADHILGRGGPELFIARALELGADFSSQAENLPIVGAICRHLDGIPLAIEFAAARAVTLGIEQVATGLRDRFALLTSRRRGTLPRHRTLRMVLDWSYGLLADSERQLLRRLSVFAGSFSLEAVHAVASRDEASEADVAAGVSDLVAKSLLVSDGTADEGCFRLLETTRAYALLKLAEGHELQELSRRHAEYYRRLLNTIEHEREKRSVSFANVDNIRAALEWCFGTNGDLAIGIRLAAATAPMFLAMSLLPECHRWSESAILALDHDARGGAEEMHLQASLGISSMQIYGPNDAARAALSKGLAIAETRGDALYQIALLGTLSMFCVRNGDFKTSLHYAERSRAVEAASENAAAMALANSILGRALQFVGEHHASRAELEASFQYWSRLPENSEVYLGFDHQALVGVGLARNLWMQGYPAQARECIQQTVSDAERKGHPASLGLALSWAPGVFLWMGDSQSALEHVDWLLSHAETYSLGPYLAVGGSCKGAVAIARGEAEIGVENMRRGLARLHTLRYEMINSGFKLALAQGLMALSKFDEGLALVDETIRLIEANGDLLYMPESLRVRGCLLLAMPQRRFHDAEHCFMQSLDWSRRQGARSWELRTAFDLATLLAADGQRGRAQAVLQPVFEQFTEGFDTADVKAAGQLLATLQ
jgi:predicted ATPase/DNA-binding winged helix-turn-helix (wHTH) protein